MYLYIMHAVHCRKATVCVVLHRYWVYIYMYDPQIIKCNSNGIILDTDLTYMYIQITNFDSAEALWHTCTVHITTQCV